MHGFVGARCLGGGVGQMIVLVRYGFFIFNEYNKHQPMVIVDDRKCCVLPVDG